jgi:hypothetical protein
MRRVGTEPSSVALLAWRQSAMLPEPKIATNAF